MTCEAALDNPTTRSCRGWMSTAVTAHVQAFLVVGRLRSFSAAARELGVSRSAVSQSVKQLEEQLGVLLLTRSTGGGHRELALRRPEGARAVRRWRAAVAAAGAPGRIPAIRRLHIETGAAADRGRMDANGRGDR